MAVILSLALIRISYPLYVKQTAIRFIFTLSDIQIQYCQVSNEAESKQETFTLQIQTERQYFYFKQDRPTIH